MPTAAVAFDFGPSYFGARLSDNIAETPEGYRICRNVCIGRSGFQSYRIAELTDPDGILADRRADELVEVWRDPEEVFSPATIASFEGKTFTVAHPGELLGPDNEREHHAGHIQNVRKGSEPLDSGDWPLLADVVITDRDAIRAIDNGERQLSCGYTYELGKTGYRLEQRKITGNHVALVPRGRAGHEARIYDAAPKESRVKNPLKHIFGLGLKEYAKDANPEDLAAAIEESKGTPASAVAIDAAPKGMAKIGQLADGTPVYGKDADPDPAMDAKAKDRKRMHDALDRQLDSAEQEEREKSEEEDAAMDAVKQLFSKDAAHPEDCDCADCKAAKDAKESEEGKVEESKDGAVISPEPTLTSAQVPQSQFDAAAALVKVLKPIIARSTDKRVKKAFDTAVTSLQAAQKKEASGGGGYSAFSASARSRGADAEASVESAEQKRARETDKIMAEERQNRRAQYAGKR